MKWCKSCVLPDTRPGVVIGEDGVCNACKNSQRKHAKIDWGARENAFSQLVEPAPAATLPLSVCL